MYALTHCTVHTSTEALRSRILLVEGDRIVGVTTSLPPGCPQINLHGYHVAAGFIDLQLNGCGGVMFNDAIAASTLDTMHQTNVRSGTTSFLPTLITTSDEDMTAAMSVVRNYRQTHPHSVLGLHLEGPYLNPKRKGIHNGTFVRSPDAPMIEAIAQAGPEVVRLMTLAPEQVPVEMIQQLTAAGIVVSAGHTNANEQEARQGFASGLSMVTHLFNAMSPWQSRSLGMVGIALDDSQVYAGIIVDGHHVHFTSVRLAKRLKGDKLFLVTDATPPAGKEMASFVIGGQTVFYREGKCVSAEGTLGGSALTMIEAISNCVHYVGIDLDEALRMASLYPARAIGVDHHLGQIAPDYIANLTIFDDDFNVIAIVDQGQFQSFCPELFGDGVLTHSRASESSFSTPALD